MRPASIALAVFLFLVVVSASPRPIFADAVLTDGSFNSLTTQSYAFNTPGEGFVTTPSVGQCQFCGVGASQGLQFSEAFVNVGAVFTASFALDNLLTYDPQTQGAISSLDVSADFDETVAFAGLTSGSFSNGVVPVIYQDGTYYVYDGPGLDGTTLNFGPGVGVQSTGYALLSQDGITADDFISYDFVTNTAGSATPNFSGDTMTFGVAEGLGYFSSPPVNAGITDWYDNLTFDVVGVPEPSSLLLLAAGLVALGLFWRRKAAADRA